MRYVNSHNSFRILLLFSHFFFEIAKKTRIVCTFYKDLFFNYFEIYKKIKQFQLKIQFSMRLIFKEFLLLMKKLSSRYL
jgi:hypothetical protein